MNIVKIDEIGPLEFNTFVPSNTGKLKKIVK